MAKDEHNKAMKEAQEQASKKAEERASRLFEESLRAQKYAGPVSKGRKSPKKTTKSSSYRHLVYQSFVTQRLDLSSRGLSVVPSVCFNAVSLQTSTLRTLSLHNNRITKVPNAISLLYCLEKLNISYNKIERLPNCIGNLTRLEVLDVTNNRLSEFPSTLTRLKSLRQLRFEGNQIEKLPHNIGRLIHLKEICAQGNKVNALNGTISSLRELELLNLNRNKLLSLAVCAIATPPLKDPEGKYDKFTDPRTGEIVYYNRTTRHCQRRRPRNYCEPTKKKQKKQALVVPMLDLSKLRITENGEDKKNTTSSMIERREKLAESHSAVWLVERNDDDNEDIYLNRITNERVSVMPLDLNRIGRLSKLCELRVRNNQIKQLPSSVQKLKCLRVLDISMNALTSLPDCLFNSNSNLESLRAAFNQLTSLPSSIRRASKLQELDVNNNKIEIVPYRLPLELRILKLGCNCITFLPVEMRDLTKLTHVTVEGNPLPQAVLDLARKHSTHGILWHCRQLGLKRSLGADPPVVERVAMGIDGEITMPLPLRDVELKQSIDRARVTNELNVEWLHLKSLPEELFSLRTYIITQYITY
jgi:Leucine-rich repeat (LRR) protein